MSISYAKFLTADINQRRRCILLRDLHVPSAVTCDVTQALLDLDSLSLNNVAKCYVEEENNIILQYLEMLKSSFNIFQNKQN